MPGYLLAAQQALDGGWEVHAGTYVLSNGIRSLGWSIGMEQFERLRVGRAIVIPS